MQEAAERPSVAPYVPHSQFVQGDVPPRLYLPAAQRVHDALLPGLTVAPKKPAAHMLQDFAPLALYVPAMHGKQEGWPVLSWYLPAVQEIHED